MNLTEIFQQYYKDFQHIKDNNLDLSNVEFNRNYALLLSVPPEWDVDSCVIDFINGSLDSLLYGAEINVVYDDFHGSDRIDLFKSKIQTEIEGDVGLHLSVSYINKSTLFEAIHRVRDNADVIQNLRKKLSEADLTIVLDWRSLDVVVKEHIEAYCTGCLIMVS